LTALMSGMMLNHLAVILAEGRRLLDLNRYLQSYIFEEWQWWEWGEGLTFKILVTLWHIVYSVAKYIKLITLLLFKSIDEVILLFQASWMESLNSLRILVTGLYRILWYVASLSK
jgi:hypothetical protein